MNTCPPCNGDCNQGRTCPNKTRINPMWKVWGIAFLIGSAIGMVTGQQMLLNSIKKDCEVLLKFRINDIPYNCRP